LKLLLGPIIEKQMAILKSALKKLLVPFILLVAWEITFLVLFWDGFETENCNSLWWTTLWLSLATICSIIVNIVLLKEESLSLKDSVVWFGIIVISIILRTFMAIAVSGVVVFIHFDAKCSVFYWNAVGWTTATLAAPWLTTMLFVKQEDGDREVDVDASEIKDAKALHREAQGESSVVGEPVTV
jgi:hypothetical protein